MEIGVQRTDSQRSQSNGPRVSFNKDVHVKRIGSRPPLENHHPSSLPSANHSANFHQSNLRREIPKDLTEEKILKEAELVLAQAESVRCRADGGENIVGGRINEKYRNGGVLRTRHQDNISKHDKKFNSLPIRKKKSKPVERSVSDAAAKSAKKVKRPTIFSLFSRKSDSQLDQIGKSSNNNNNSSSSNGSSGTSSKQRQKVGRSKSDVGLRKNSNEIRRKRNNSENEEHEVNIKKKTQLSPIIEVSQREDYFSEPKDEEDKKKKETAPHKFIQEETDLTASKPVSNSIQEAINTLSSQHSKSIENMHSSQVPAVKLPLTKGRQVDGMVKRLSMERFSPPPHLSGPAFSYTRSPTEQNIIYAQVVYDENGKTKQTVHSSNFLTKEPIMSASSQHKLNGGGRDEVDDIKVTTNTTRHYIQDQQRDYPPSQEYYKTKVTIEPTPKSSFRTKEPFRNHSDEDEGLGFEIKRSIEDDQIPVKDAAVNDDPIKPRYRDVPPEKPPQVFEHQNRGRADGMDSFFPEFRELAERRKILESRIQSRRNGSRELLDEISPERDFYKNPMHQPQPALQRVSHSPERVQHISDEDLKKYHKPNSREIHTRYSPQRSHLDMIATPSPHQTAQTTSTKVVKETKYFHNGHDGVKETYNSETKVGQNGRPYTTEHRTRERIGSSPKEIDLGYIEDVRDFKYDHHVEPDTSYFQNKYRMENEPKSLDSQFSEMNRSATPEPSHHYQNHVSKVTSRYVVEDDRRHMHKSNPDLLDAKYPSKVEYENTLKRQKKAQRSFDKGDSGIENDYRKDSFNSEIQSKWKKRTYLDDMKSSDIFIKRERTHTNDTSAPRRFININYRERSIDDGSRYDPHLDKYITESRSRTQSRSKSVERNDSMKHEKKISGLEKVKQLFTGGGTNKKKTTVAKKPSPDKEMVREEEMRARYMEYRPSGGDAVASSSQTFESKNFDISTRRRLSTPKASPVPKRTLSQKSSKSSSDSTAQKLGWFKSIDRLSRKKQNKKIESATEDEVSSLRKTKVTTSTTAPSKSSFNHSTPSKNLRFFGDTDLESNPSLSKSALKPKTRHSLGPSNLSTQSQKKFSKSAHELDSLSKAKVDRSKSTSLYNLDKEKTLKSHARIERERSRSRQLQNIEESLSASENEHEDERDREQKRRRNIGGPGHRAVSPISEMKSMQRMHKSSSKSKSNSPSHEIGQKHEMHIESKRYVPEESYRNGHSMDHHRSVSRDRSPPPVERSIRYGSEDRGTLRRGSEGNKPPPGPPKPARTLDRRRGMSKEHDRVHDSSGTEGESSQLSQRSVVYLHATTVGEIPQPYVLNARTRAASRDDLSSGSRSKSLTPMTRTVSRSVSVLAPWKPKHLRDGYEINYSQQNNEKMKKYENSRHDSGAESRRSSTLSRPKKETTPHPTSTLTRTRKSHSRDELSSDKSSKGGSTGGPSILSSATRSKSDYRSPSHSRDTVDYRHETIARSHNKENNSRPERTRYN